MDYSMLIAIELSNQPKSELHQEDELNVLEVNEGRRVSNKVMGQWMSSKHRFQHDSKILHISIIDYLQEWNLNKKAERVLKTYLLQKDGEGLSSVEPEAYMKRFKAFMEEHVFH